MTNTETLKQGDRVELIRTTDIYTAMTPGEKGTVAKVYTDQVEVNWDCGSRLAMIPSEGDIIVRAID